MDVERRQVASAGAVLPRGQPEVRARVEAAREDVRRRPESRVRLVPGYPRHGAPCAGEVDRRRLCLCGRVNVEGRGEALGHPGPVFEGANEYLLAVPGLLLERRPRDLDLAGRERSAGDVRDASVLVRVDRIGDIVVHLRAVGRKRQEGRACCRAGKQHAHGRKTGDRQPQTARARGHLGRSRLHETFLLLGFVCGSAPAGFDAVSIRSAEVDRRQRYVRAARTDAPRPRVRSSLSLGGGRDLALGPGTSSRTVASWRRGHGLNGEVHVDAGGSIAEPRRDLRRTERLRIDASVIVVPADVTVDVSPNTTTGPAGSVRLRATAGDAVLAGTPSPPASWAREGSSVRG